MGPEVLSDIFISLSICTLIFGIYYMRSRENMALIERGINPRVKEVVQNTILPSRPYLKYGLFMIGCGVGMLLARIIDVAILPHQMLSDGLLNNAIEDKNKLVYVAFIALGGGLGLVMSYFIERKEWRRQKTGH